MSIRVAAVVAILAVLLGVFAVVLGRRQPAAPAAAAALLDFDPARVSALAVTEPEGETHRFLRGQGGAWIRVGPGAGPDDGWPVDPRYPRRLLQQIDAATRRAAGDGPPPPERVGVALRFLDGAERRLDLAARPVGGQARAWVDGEGPFLVALGVLDAATEPPPGAWRTPGALPGLGPFNIARIRLSSGAEILVLERRRNRWRLTEPVTARASADAVRALIERLTAVEVQEFIGAPSPSLRAAAALDRPILVIEAEASTPRPSGGADPDRTPLVRTLIVGGPATAAGERRLASAGGDGLVAIPAGSVEGLSLDPAEYLARTPTPTSSADVGAMRITTPAGGEIVLERAFDLWRDAGRPEAEPSALLADLAEGLLELLHTPAASASMRPAGGAPERLGVVELRSLGGDPLHEIELVRWEGADAAIADDVLYVYGEAVFPAWIEAPAGAAPR